MQPPAKAFLQLIHKTFCPTGTSLSGAKPELIENVLMLDIMQPGGPILWGTWFRLWQVCKQWVCSQTTMCSGAAPCIILGSNCHSSPYRVSFDITNGSPKMIVIHRAGIEPRLPNPATAAHNRVKMLRMLCMNGFKNFGQSQRHCWDFQSDGCGWS